MRTVQSPCYRHRIQLCLGLPRNDRFPQTPLARVSGFQDVYFPTPIWSVAQVAVYLPEDVLAIARKRAKHGRKSLSAWVSARIHESTSTDWPESLVNPLHHGTGDIVEPDDATPRDLNFFA